MAKIKKRKAHKVGRPAIDFAQRLKDKLHILKEGDLITIKEAAEYLKIHQMTMWKFIREKKIHFFFKVGGRWRTRKDLIEKYLQECIEK